MKKILIILISIFFINISGFTQNASTFFPSNTGYKWYYKNTPLDTNNNPVTNLARYRIDSFAVNSVYQGLQASIVRLKDNLLTSNQNTAYNDTNYHNFNGTNGWEFLKISFLPDTVAIPIGFLNFLRGLQNWYSLYRFAQTVNQEYIVIQKDTTISIDTISAPLRVKLKGKRLNDEVITTVNGTYTAKKFLITYGLYLHIIVVDIPLIERPDTTWIASEVWMVKQVTPTVKFSLTQLGIPLNIPIPGNIYEPIIPVGIKNISSDIPDKFELYQNYPNPFNPVTNIKYQISKNSFVSLIVFDILGKEIVSLVNQNQNAGTYIADWDATNYSSGIYFYKFEAGGFKDVKRMIIVK